MKLRYDLHIQKVGEVFLGITTGDDAKVIPDVLRLNETGARIVELLRQDISRETLVATLLEEYDVEENELAGYIDDVLNYLSRHSCLDGV